MHIHLDILRTHSIVMAEQRHDLTACLILVGDSGVGKASPFEYRSNRPLHLAARHSHVWIVKRLLATGRVNVNACALDNQTQSVALSMGATKQLSNHFLKRAKQIFAFEGNVMT